MFRIKNLLIIALTMISMRYGVITPIFEQYGLTPQMPILDFGIMILATILIGAAGYVINDYFDQKIDMINRHDKVVIGKKISRRAAILAHWILNILGLSLGIWLSYRIEMWGVSIVYFIVTAIFWFYSLSLKSSGLLGNISVSTMAFLVPFQVILFESTWIMKTPATQQLADNAIVIEKSLYIILIFSLFSFITNLIREIIKDFEDIKGDARYHRRSLPIVLGPAKAKCTVQIITSLTTTIVAVLYIVFLYHNSYNTIIALYLLTLIIIPLLLVIYKTHKARHTYQYKLPGKIIKFVMLTGILFPILFPKLFQSL